MRIASMVVVLMLMMMMLRMLRIFAACALCLVAGWDFQAAALFSFQRNSCLRFGTTIYRVCLVVKRREDGERGDGRGEGVYTGTNTNGERAGALAGKGGRTAVSFPRNDL